MMPVFSWIPLLMLAVVIGGCSPKQEPRLEGERRYILEQQSDLSPDATLANLAVKIPPPQVNPAWPAAGGYPDHAMGHLSLGEALTKQWSLTVGEGIDAVSRLPQPVIADNQVVTMDSAATVTAVDASRGNQLWQVALRPEGETYSIIGGGVAHAGSLVIAATGYAEVVALQGSDGAILWRKRLNAPVRSAPTISNGRIFVITTDNELIALSVGDGEKLWAHAGFEETLSIAGGSSPAVSNNVVVAAYSSGELVGLRADNGRVLWADNLGSIRDSTAFSRLSDIVAHPVIDNDRVFAVSINRRMVAIDTRTGRRVWSQPISSLQTPWVAGEYVYVLTTDARVVCLRRDTGQIVWIAALEAFEDAEKKRDPIVWIGPVLGGDRLIVASSTRRAVSISPYTGKILGEIDLPSPLAISPVIAGETLYLLTNEAELLAFR